MFDRKLCVSRFLDKSFESSSEVFQKIFQKYFQNYYHFVLVNAVVVVVVVVVGVVGCTVGARSADPSRFFLRLPETASTCSVVRGGVRAQPLFIHTCLRMASHSCIACIA